MYFDSHEIKFDPLRLKAVEPDGLRRNFCSEDRRFVS